MSIDKTHCKTVLIDDKPASVDNFGPHSELARVIAELITSEDGGVTIGIQGNWGSGKSTLVNLVVDELSNNHPQVAPIQFDAWAHQGDPLRRSFLEKLIEEFKAREWVLQEYLQSQIDTLSRRKKVARKTSNPILKPLGAFMASGILLVPVGLATLNAALRDGLTLAWSGWKSISFLAVGGFVLAINPLLVYGGAWLIWWIKKKRGRTDKEWAEAGGWNAVLLRQYSTQELTETISDQDPTSVEFERIFGGLLDRALEKPERRLILILDNLDRVDPDDARTVLSTLQTFLQDSFASKMPWFDRLWIMIPYAPDGMSMLFESSSSGKNSGRGGVAATERFLDKRFQIRFEVPPIVRSDWGEYLKNQLSIALPEHPKVDNEFHLVYRIFDLARFDRSIPPTPRDIKLLVNQIGALHRVWRDSFPLHHLAYYAVISKGDGKIVEHLRTAKLPDPNLAALLGRGAADSLAALAFGVEVSKARELILMPEITAALQENQLESFAVLAERHPEGIWTVLERVPFEDWSASEVNSLANAASVLLQFGFMEKAPSGPKELTIESLAAAFSTVDRWEPLGDAIGAGIAAMLELKPADDLARRLLDTMEAPIDVDDGEPASEMTDRWIETIVPVLHAIARVDLENTLSAGIQIPGNQAWILRVLSSLQANASMRQYVRYMRSELQASDVTNYLTETIANGQLSEEDVNSFEALRDLFPELDWQNVGEAAFQRLRADGAYEPAEISGMLGALWKLAAWQVIPRGQLEQLANSSNVLHHLHHSQSQQSNEAIAWCLLTQMVMRPDPSQPPEPTGDSANGWGNFNTIIGNPDEYQETLGRFTELADRLGLQSTIVDTAEQVVQWRPWLGATLDQLVSRGSALKLVEPNEFAEKHNFVKGILADASFKSLASSLVAETSLLADVNDEPFDIGAAPLYLDLILAGGSENSDYNRWISESLKAVNSGDWLTAMTNESALLDLVSERYRRGGRFKLGLPYSDGLVEYAKLLVAGQSTPQNPDRLSGMLLNVVWGDDRSALRRRLLDRAIEADGDIALEFFGVFGAEIADIEMIKADSEIVRKLFEPIVREKNAAGIAWLNSLFARDRDLLAGYRPQYDVNQLQERVREAAGADIDEALADGIRDLADSLGVEFAEPESDEGSNSKQD